MNIECSIGNHKIGKDTIIFNMGPSEDCPSKALKLCRVEAICYAKKAERQYPAVIPYRKRQATYWKSHSSGEIIKDVKSFIGKRSILYFRVNESGDFYSQNCIEKLKMVAEGLPNIVVYTYTARRDLDYNNLPNNLIINGSSFMVDNEFRAVKEYTGNHYTCMGNCRLCSLCKAKRGIIIEVKTH